MENTTPTIGKPRKPRRSFGGKEGVLWTNRSNEKKYHSESEENEQDSVEKKQGTPTIGWDDDLCRPIYYTKNVVSDGINDESSQDDNEEQAKGDSKSKDKELSQDSVIPETSTLPKVKIAPSKPKRTFVGRGPRPLSVLLYECDYGEISSPEIEKTRKQLRSNDSPSSLSATTVSASSLEVTVTNNGNNILSPQEGIATSQSESSKEDSKSMVSVTTSSPSKLLDFGMEDNNNHQEESVVETSKRRGKRKRSQKQTSMDPSLQKAKEYFQNLDATHKLKLESFDSPIQEHLPSSRVTRTSRKARLDSPRMQREYKEYSKSMAESGISPLSLEEYSKGRREHFRRGELFDGFFDD